MIIAHFKPTPIAYAPEAICDVINHYTEHKAFVFGYEHSGGNNLNSVHILHQHNKNAINFPKKLIQYHSEPFRVDLNVNIPKLVIAQYHATLPEYQDCLVVRNPIDIFQPVFLPKYTNGKIRIGFSPSLIMAQSKWADKGYIETVVVLDQILAKYRDKIEVDIITNVPLNICLRRKSLCNIFIDEVKTGSYHRSGLEALAMGQVTICRVSPEVETVMLKASGADNLPFVNVSHDQLYSVLVNLIESGLDNIHQEGFKSRQWMENYWNPAIIANEYVQIYESVK